MKLLPIATALSCAALLIGCGRPAASNSDTDKQDQERLAEEQAALQLSQLHEREAALDEREALLAQREQQLATPSIPSAPSQPPEQPAPLPLAPASAQSAPVQPASPSLNASYEVFFDALSPYGSWVLMTGYGYVWQPSATAQDSRWRPYTIGNWAYTNDGWTWISNEPFGWITYHYGRWMRTRTLGWVWFPGDQWAPAWVSWRYGNEFVGWAPLPPEARFNPATGIQQWADQQYNLGATDYTFVPASDFGDDNMADVDVPPDDNGPIYENSNIETNIYYDTTTYVIICYGPNYEFMRSKARHPLRPPLILTRAGFRAGGKNGAVISGNALQVAAPRIVQPRDPVAPKTVRGSVADTRLIAAAAPPSVNGAAAPPLYQTPQAPQAVGTQPAAVPQPGSRAAGAPNQPRATNNPPPGMRPSETNPVPPNAVTQQARDLQIIQQQQTERERQLEAAKAAEQQQRAEALRAEETTRAEQAATEEQSSKAAREQQAAREQAIQAAHASQSSGVPAASPLSGPGHL
jgi:hypothetical protein